MIKPTKDELKAESLGHKAFQAGWSPARVGKYAFHKDMDPKLGNKLAEGYVRAHGVANNQDYD